MKSVESTLRSPFLSVRFWGVRGGFCAAVAEVKRGSKAKVKVKGKGEARETGRETTRGEPRKSQRTKIGVWDDNLPTLFMRKSHS